jgi:hypothetical protein
MPVGDAHRFVCLVPFGGYGNGGRSDCAMHIGNAANAIFYSGFGVMSGVTLCQVLSGWRRGPGKKGVWCIFWRQFSFLES